LQISVKRRSERATICGKVVVDQSGFAIRTSRVRALRELAGVVIEIDGLRIVARAATPTPTPSHHLSEEILVLFNPGFPFSLRVTNVVNERLTFDKSVSLVG
jgi:hypothetical protein